MDKPEESAVRVTMRTSSAEESSAAAEWDVESTGDATTVDPDALSKLRATGALEAVSASEVASASEAGAEAASASETDSTAASEGASSEFADAADEFDSAPATVMEDIEQLSASELLEVVDSGSFGGKASEEFEDDSVTRMDSRVVPALADPETVASKEECPHCGVLVLPGYPNCPRCKKSLVTAAVREHGAAGGTSLGGRTIPWTIVFIAAVLTAVIVYLAERDENISEVEETGAGAVQASPNEVHADDTAVLDDVEAEEDAVNDEAGDEAAANKERDLDDEAGGDDSDSVDDYDTDDDATGEDDEGTEDDTGASL